MKNGKYANGKFCKCLSQFWDESFEWIEISAYLEVRQKLAPLACQKRLKTVRRLKSDCETCQSNGRRHFPHLPADFDKTMPTHIRRPKNDKKRMPKSKSSNPDVTKSNYPCWGIPQWKGLSLGNGCDSPDKIKHLFWRDSNNVAFCLHCWPQLRRV